MLKLLRVIVGSRDDFGEMFTVNRAHPRTPPSDAAWRDLVVVFLPFHRSRKNSKAEGHQRGQKHARASFSNAYWRVHHIEKTCILGLVFQAPWARWKKLVEQDVDFMLNDPVNSRFPAYQGLCIKYFWIILLVHKSTLKRSRPNHQLLR